MKKIISVVIPCYCVKSKILWVLSRIGSEVTHIYIVDDCCPEHTADYVMKHCSDSRVSILRNDINLGVGGAVMVGYRQAIIDGADFIVKIDGDGQMDPALIEKFVNPIAQGEADYTKGNRFFDLESLVEMPKVRLFGNAILSFMAKLSTGYWNLFDPTNGYTAISSKLASRLAFEKISKRFFFESDILFRLNLQRAVVVDIPMVAKYSDEISNLNVKEILFEFLYKNIKNFFKRVFYNYYLRDMSVASIELPMGILLLMFGFVYGLSSWCSSIQSATPSPVGTVVLSAVTMLSGMQLLLSFINYDIGSVPNRPITKDV